MIEQHLKLFACLNRRGAEYLLIGGALSIAYGVPRVTKDIDLFLNPVPENAEALLQSLKEMGFGTANMIDAKEICQTEVTIFKDILRVDILTKVKGLTFEKAWQNKVFLELDRVMIPSLSLDDLIRSKKAAGRTGDLEDVKILEMARTKNS